MPTLSWIKQLGSASWDYANSIAVDQWGNVFISGYTYTEVELGPRQQAEGRSDAFLAKYTAEGTQDWIKQLGSASSDRATSIAVDQWGNVFISGYTDSELAAGQAKGGPDAFLAKYTAEGEQDWIKQLGSASSDRATSIAVDQWGNVFISGCTDSELVAGQAKGGPDAFLAKYTAEGEQDWIKQLGSASRDEATSIAVDQWGNVFISGYTDSELVAGQAKGRSDAFLAKYTAEGEQDWIKQLGSASSDRATSIAVDQWGNVFISGYTDSELVAGQAKGGPDAFLAKYTAEGEQDWIKQLGSASRDEATSIAVDQWGHVFISGLTYGELAAGQAKGGPDAFLAKYTAEGEPAWIKQLGSAYADSATAIAVDQWGHVFISGLTRGKLAAEQAKGALDAFLAKYVDDLSTTQHHLLAMKRFDQLSKEMADLKQELYSQNNDLSLIGLANEYTKGRKGNKISIAEAEKIIAKAQDSDKNISESSKKTLAFIYSKYETTAGAADLILSQIMKK